jgi:microcystin-dependent protein
LHFYEKTRLLSQLYFYRSVIEDGSNSLRKKGEDIVDNFIGEVRLFAFGRVPSGWVVCDGRILPIATNQALFALLGTQYGGDGRTTFAIPDLRGRIPVQKSASLPQGSKGGSESVTLTNTQLPLHTHFVSAYSTNGNTGALASGFPAQCSSPSITPAPPPAPAEYGSAANLLSISPASIASSGSTTAVIAHENRQPSIALNYCLATTGVYPSRS